MVEMLSRGKAVTVARYYEDALIIGSDTIVSCGGRMLGKPRDEEDACRMLSMIQGATHDVFTGVAVVDTAGIRRSDGAGELRERDGEREGEHTASDIRLGDTGQYRIASESPDGRPRIIVGHTASKVTFRPMTDHEIRAYVKTGFPMDKAGAYGVQELGAVFIEKIAGDFYSIMGLPLNLLYQMLLPFGISPFHGEI